jgi:subtilisin family serine protease
MKGVAPGANLIAVQVFSYIEDWYDVGSFFSDQIKGLEYVYGLRGDHCIAAANLSLGSGYYSDYCDYDPRKPAIDNLRAAGIAVTVANGNDGYCEALNSPACVSSAIAVGASDSNDHAYWFNDWHPVMQNIFAPGVAIFSASSWSDTGYSIRTGTSMAAPHVAGAWAIFRQSAPNATVSDIEDAMKNSGVLVDSGCDTEPSSGPRINVATTLDYLLASFDIPTLSETGMILFILLIAGGAILFIRRWKKTQP